MQLVVLARNFACESAGRSIAARIAMMAITTSNSMSVNAFLPRMDAWRVITILSKQAGAYDPAPGPNDCRPNPVGLQMMVVGRGYLKTFPSANAKSLTLFPRAGWNAPYNHSCGECSFGRISRFEGYARTKTTCVFGTFH